MKASPLPAYSSTISLAYFAENYEPLAQQAAEKRLSHLDYLERLIEGEYLRRSREPSGACTRPFPVHEDPGRLRLGLAHQINEMKVKNLSA